MSNRQALRAFQSHLAARLKDARESGVAASWLAIQAAGANYLFPLSSAGEIFPWTDNLLVPYTRPWFMGVANLRGGLYGVIDLANYLSGVESSPRGEMALAQCRLVTLGEALGVNCALLVDRLVGLRNAEAFSSATAPPADAPVHFGRVFLDLAGVSWQEIDLQSLSQNPEFLSIGA